MNKERTSTKRRRSYSDRVIATLELVQRFLIVCEGEKTEPLYFKKFRVPTIVLDVRHIKGNTIGLVLKAIEIKENDDFDQVWCVFDRDSFPPKDFNEALRVAKDNNIKVAYSNEAFELWYLLHFNFHNTELSRTQYQRKLTKCLGHVYAKNSETMYDELSDRQNVAIRNAELLLANYHPLNPVLNNPSTTVHLLVKELRKNSR